MLSAQEIQGRKSPPLVMVTAYDFAFAGVLEEAGVDIVLVGDSAANVVLGLPSTRGIGLEELLLFTAAVARGAPGTHVLADMPYGSDATPDLAVSNARRFVAAGAASVKLEGPKLDVVRALTEAKIPVMGHLGVMPQTAASFRRVGKSEADGARLLREALDLQAAGAYTVLLENVAAAAARRITAALSVPTIGIGSGPGVTGQVQVLHDLLGLSRHPPPFAQAFADLRPAAVGGIRAFGDAVRRGDFPAPPERG